MARIKVHPSKCIGCGLCEAACSLHHVFHTNNPKRSRIKVVIEDNFCYPVIAGPITEAECNAKKNIIINDKEYDYCLFCSSPCPTRPWFHEPDDPETPLKCDFCGEPPLPHCAEWCPTGALEFLETAD
jgi:benzoyl-CoA reductase subunit BamC